MIRYIGNHLKKRKRGFNSPFSHDVTPAILVFQNNETAAMLVFLTNPMGVELFSNVNAFCGHVVENDLLAQSEPWNALLTTSVIKICVILLQRVTKSHADTFYSAVLLCLHCLKITPARGKMKRVKPDTCHMLRLTLTVDCSSNDQ